MSEASEAMRCDLCGTLIPKRVSGLCMPCVNLRDLMIPLMANERARAYIMSQFLSGADADAILDMHALTATFGCGPRTNPRRKAWKKLVALARKVSGRET